MIFGVLLYILIGIILTSFIKGIVEHQIKSKDEEDE
jgi:hypothetical protein